MPVYEYQCKGCKKEFDVTLSVADYGKVKVECEKCRMDLTRVINSPVSVSIPQHMRADGSKYHGRQPQVPINIIDEKPDGGYRVTRYGSKSDIDNE